jgi:putative copper export protein
VTDLLPEAAAKALLYSALLVLCGACTAHFALLRIRSVADAETERVDRSLASIGLGSAVLVLVALLLRLGTHTAAVFGASGALSWPNVSVVAFESRWGSAWRVQTGVAAALAAAAGSTRVLARAGWIGTATGSAALSFVLPLTGHAAGWWPRVLLHGSHLLAAGMWLGTLAVILAISRRRGSDAQALAAAAYDRFALVALPSAAVLVIAGLIAAGLYVGSVAGLIATAYGRVLMLKASLFGGVVTCGYLNWRRVDSARRAGGGPVAMLALPEVCFAAAVIAITAILTELEHP